MEKATADVTVATEVDLTKAAQEDSLVAEVLRQFDINLPISRRAAEMWLEARLKELQNEPLGTTVHRFQSEEMVRRTIAFLHGESEPRDGREASHSGDWLYRSKGGVQR